MAGPRLARWSTAELRQSLIICKISRAALTLRHASLTKMEPRLPEVRVTHSCLSSDALRLRPLLPLLASAMAWCAWRCRWQGKRGPPTFLLRNFLRVLARPLVLIHLDLLFIGVLLYWFPASSAICWPAT